MLRFWNINSNFKDSPWFFLFFMLLNQCCLVYTIKLTELIFCFFHVILEYYPSVALIFFFSRPEKFAPAPVVLSVVDVGLLKSPSFIFFFLILCFYSCFPFNNWFIVIGFSNMFRYEFYSFIIISYFISWVSLVNNGWPGLIQCVNVKIFFFNI
jgi:hypothetical protein